MEHVPKIRYLILIRYAFGFRFVSLLLFNMKKKYFRIWETSLSHSSWFIYADKLPFLKICDCYTYILYILCYHHIVYIYNCILSKVLKKLSKTSNLLISLAF